MKMDKTLRKSDKTIRRPQWLNFFFENYLMEVNLAAKTPLVPVLGRHGIWAICRRINQERHGIPGQACQLLERYMEKVIFRPINQHTENSIVDAHLRALRSNIDILIGTCIILALKMSKRITKYEEIALRLQVFDSRFTVSDIVRMEFEVFKELDYYVPSYTTVEVSELLGQEINLSRRELETVEYVVNLAELHRPAIEKKVRWVGNVRQLVSICTLHFAAGGVVATVRFLGHPSLDPVLHLVRLTGASPEYLQCIANAILSEME